MRLDKGSRAMVGLIRTASESAYVMLVDYDDLVSRRITAFIAGAMSDDINHKELPAGWLVNQGYLFDDGPLTARLSNGFNSMCGTSVIVRRDLLRVPASLDQLDREWAATCLGSHLLIAEALAEQGSTLEQLPFPGAAYRIGHSGATSGSPSVVRKMFTPWVLRHPRVLAGNVAVMGTRRPLRAEFSLDR